MLCSAHSFRTETKTTTGIAVESGLLSRPDLSSLLRLSPRSRHFLITDQTVHRLYGIDLLSRLREDVPNLEMVVLPDGEHSKSLTGYAELATKVLNYGPDEGSTLIALGGGMITNLTGMLAATLYRGVRLLHMPTTLMAQCDAAIGHKQAINGPTGKNLLGAYYAPDLIFVDPNVLQTLAPWQIQDGFAEVIKHALAQDPTYLLDLLDPSANLDDNSFLGYCVQRNVALKCELMRVDPLERDQGMVLQYGHTVGHAVEHASDFEFGHGEAVSVGMMAAARIAQEMGIASVDVVDVHRDLLRRYGLLRSFPASVSVVSLMQRVAAGKRCVNEVAYMALIDKPGQLCVSTHGCAIPVPLRLIEGVLEDHFASRSLPSRYEPMFAVGAQ